MEKHDFRYEPLSPSEQKLGMRLAMALTTDEEILNQIDDFHDSGARCAAVLVLEAGEFTGGYVGNETAISERFPFPQIADALNTYEPGETVCLVIQRDNLVSVGVIGASNPPDFQLN